MRGHIVDVEVAIGIPPARNALGVFLHHHDLDGKAEAETIVHAYGGEYTVYPTEAIPAQGKGFVEIRDTNLYIWLGPSEGHDSMYVISPMTVKSDEVKGIDRAFVYMTDGPYDPLDSSEKIWLAVNLPLVINGKGEE